MLLGTKNHTHVLPGQYLCTFAKIAQQVSLHAKVARVSLKLSNARLWHNHEQQQLIYYIL